MKKKPGKTSAEDLRREAEIRLNSSSTGPSVVGADVLENARLAHELEVHQVELEMQNDELERARAEAEEAMIRYSDLYEFAPVGYATVARDGTILQINLTGVRLIGADRSAVVGQRLSSWLAPASLGVFSSFLNRLFDKAGQLTCEVCLRSETGPIDLELRGASEDGKDECRLVATDVSARNRSVAERERLTKAIEQVAEVVVITDTLGTISYVNPAFEAVTGYSRAEAIGSNPRVLASGKHDEAFYRNLWDTISAGKTWHGRMINKKKDGALFTEDATISPVRDAAGQVTHYVAVKRDVTQELALEEQLAQARRMESIGRLAGGVAHDFNNLLSVILNCTVFALEAMPAGHPARNDLQEVKAAGERGAALTRQLLAFGRQQVMQPVSLSLNEVTHGLSPMLRRLLGEGIEYQEIFATDLGLVRVDRIQMEQVLLNLLTNARDAMPRGGKLSIETSNAESDPAHAASRGSKRVGPQVLLSVTDTGPGMDLETQAQLFEPFFTTKEKGKGTGLGLATVYGIVNQSGGHITVISTPGRGSTFTISLPRDTAPTVPPALPGDTPPVVEAVVSATLLVVEDEDALRKVAARILTSAGYTVLTAANGEEALAVYGQHPEIRLVMTDVVMPKMSGGVLAKALKHLTPNLRILFVSGYADDVIVHHGVLEEGTSFLAKPFDPSTLLQRVRRLLGATSPNPT